MGFMPENPNTQEYKDVLDTIYDLCLYASQYGINFCFETGQETPVTLLRVIETVGTGNLGINLDPANLVMVTGDDPVQAVYNLKDYIVHTHAKDGKQIFYRDPEIVYGIKKDVIVTDDSFLEVPLGEGSVDFPKYLAALEEIGYNGFLTIEREVGDDPAKDIRAAVDFLNGLMK